MYSNFDKHNLNFFTKYIYIILLSFHVFFWGSFQFIEYKINFQGINFLNLKIGIFFIFLYYIIRNYKSFLKKNLIVIIFFLLLLIHLLINFDNNFFIEKKLIQFLMIFSIFVVCNNYYNFIIKNLKKIIFFFIIVISFSLVFDFIEGDFLSKLKQRKLLIYIYILSENSHIAIMIIPVIFYLIFNNHHFSFSYFLGLVIAFIFGFLFYSTTLIAGFFLIILFSFIFFFNSFLKRLPLIIILIVTFILSLWLSKYYNIYERNLSNDNKIIGSLKLGQEFVKYEDIQNIKNEDIQNIKNEDIDKEIKIKNIYKNTEDEIYLPPCHVPITPENYLYMWKNQKQNIREFFLQNYSCLPLRTQVEYLENFYKDLTISVIINSALVAFLSTIEKFYGHGINNYETCFAKHMVINIVPIYKEVYLLNYNDGSSTLFKLICEFGFFAVLFFYVFLKFTFNNKISIQSKLFFISIVLVQLGRGVGYINGGFAFSFAIMFAHFFYNNNIHFFKKSFLNEKK